MVLLIPQKSNDHEYIDPFEDLPIELKHLIEKPPAYEIIKETLLLT